jgi:hypothetical protein
MEKGKIVQKHDSSTKREITHYFALVMGLLFFTGLAYFYRTDHQVQLLSFFFASVYYALWGVFHHFMENRLTWAVAAEYVFFAFIVFLLVVLSLGVSA